MADTDSNAVAERAARDAARDSLRKERAAQESLLKDAIRRGEDIGIIRRDGNSFGNRCYTSWTGRRDDLIAASICTVEQFPEGRKRYVGSDSGPWEGRTTRRLAADAYVHTVRLIAVDLADKPKCDYTRPSQLTSKWTSDL